MSRTTHSDLAQQLELIAKRLLTNTMIHGDGAALGCIRDAARILQEQDAKIDQMTIDLRALRYPKP